MQKHLIKWLSEIIKKGKGSDTYALASRRYCLNYSKVYSDVTERWLLAWNKKKKNYILHVLCTNSKFSIDLPYNSTDLLPANKYN